MGILTGSEIKNRLGKDIIIEPFNEDQLNPNSYNLKLDNVLYVYKDKTIDAKKQNKYEKIIIPESGFTLRPGTVYLGKTVEYTETHNLVPLLDGRSSTGRLGLTASVDAGFGDIGFKGNWTLELSVVQPLVIYPNMKICQISYNTITGDTDIVYNGKYQNSKEILPSKLYEDFK